MNSDLSDTDCLLSDPTDVNSDQTEIRPGSDRRQACQSSVRASPHPIAVVRISAPVLLVLELVLGLVLVLGLGWGLGLGLRLGLG